MSHEPVPYNPDESGPIDASEPQPDIPVIGPKFHADHAVFLSAELTRFTLPGSEDDQRLFFVLFFDRLDGKPADRISIPVEEAVDLFNQLIPGLTACGYGPPDPDDDGEDET